VIPGRCNKLAGVDVAACLDGPEDTRWNAIRVHVEKCDDCREELAAWRSLRASLAADGDGHPAVDLLLAYADDRSSLAASVSAQIEGHLAACASCRDEIGVLGAVMIRPGEATATLIDSKPAESSVWQRILAALSGPVWRPALALAVLVVLTVPALRWIDRESELMQIGETRNDAAPPASIQALPAPALPAAPAPAETVVEQAPSRRIVVPQSAMEPSAINELAQRKAWQQDREANLQRRQAERYAERDAAMLRRDEASVHVMRKGLAADAPAPPPTLDFVPGGRASLQSGNYDQVVLRVTFVRAANAPTERHADEQASSGTPSPEPASTLTVPSTVSELEVRVTTADGRQSIRRVNVGPAEPGKTSSTLEVSISADSLASGANAFEIVEPGGRTIATDPFVVERVK